MATPYKAAKKDLTNQVKRIKLRAVALAAIVTKSDSSYRCLKSVKRTA